MFGFNESKTITASYEDAVRFVGGMMREQFEKLDGDAKEGSAQRLLARLAIASRETSGAVKAVAFVFGVTEAQVRSDIAKP